MREFKGDMAADVDENNGRGNGRQKNPRLLMGLDDSKDQSYFLSMTKVRRNSPTPVVVKHRLFAALTSLRMQQGTQNIRGQTNAVGRKSHMPFLNSPS